ncbi:hypothetical protein [Carboxylicivirga marina]|uniref:hypothetical protein n=1 Tax=Carboxylicivirga marina TaxID=2800988 RepID=UPI0025978756|nr:hypothetical protein [uncultured Carboxylicivirga sp.]
MKKQLLSLTLIILPILISAQGQIGVRELNGNFIYSLSDQEDVNHYIQEIVESNRHYLDINSKIGWFITEHSVLGLGVGFEYMKIENSNKYKDYLLSLSPYFRNYQKISDKLFYTTTIEMSIGIGKEQNNPETIKEIASLALTARPGLSYFLSDKWALTTHFGYITYKKTNKEVSKGMEDEHPKLNDTDFGISFNMNSFRLGVGYYF